jgi:hypothetical protein
MYIVKWWGEYGDDTPELKEFAMKVLGLTCSASACERNWSTFNQVHTKRRNRLTAKRMNDLVYIMYNKKLKQKFIKKGTLKEEEDPLVLENVVSDDEWIAEPANDADGEAAIEGGETGGEGSGGVGEPSSGTGGESSSSVKRKAAQKKVQSRKKKAAQIHLIDEEDDFEDMENETDEEGEYEEQDDSDEDSFYAV